MPPTTKGSITIHISDGPRGALVTTNGEPPAVGRLQTPAQSLAMDLLITCRRQAAATAYGEQGVPHLAFLRDLLNPEVFGWAVTAEVRDRARILLGQEAVETRIARGDSAC